MDSPKIKIMIRSVLTIACFVPSFVANHYIIGAHAFSSCTLKAPCTASSSCLAATRRSLLENVSKSLTVGTAALLLGGSNGSAREVTDASSGTIPDLPNDAQRSYLQYRFPLQLAADFYIFDLQEMVKDTGAYLAFDLLSIFTSLLRLLTSHLIYSKTHLGKFLSWSPLKGVGEDRDCHLVLKGKMTILDLSGLVLNSLYKYLI